MAGGRANVEQEARQTIQDLKLNLFDLNVPLFSGQTLQTKLAELLEKTLCPENLNFLQDMLRLSLVQDSTQDFAELMKKIMKIYIAPGSANEINLDSDTPRR